jgi:FtsZ-binding cell division protein ZapB
MTQTTEERIATIINEGVTGECDGAITGQMSTAQIIAAEIDNLRERNAFLLASAEAAQAQLAACRRELAEARAFISTVVDAPGEAS